MYLYNMYYKRFKINICVNINNKNEDRKRNRMYDNILYIRLLGIQFEGKSNKRIKKINIVLKVSGI